MTSQMVGFQVGGLQNTWEQSHGCPLPDEAGGAPSVPWFLLYFQLLFLGSGRPYENEVKRWRQLRRSEELVA